MDFGITDPVSNPNKNHITLKIGTETNTFYVDPNNTKKDISNPKLVDLLDNTPVSTMVDGVDNYAEETVEDDSTPSICSNYHPSDQTEVFYEDRGSSPPVQDPGIFNDYDNSKNKHETNKRI